MDVIQPWQLYLILQADSIREVGANVAFAASLTAVLISVAAGIGCFIYFASSGELGVSPYKLWRNKWSVLLFYTAVFAVNVVCSMIPSTKTAAIMFGVPAVVNNPTFQHETGEVYQLLKKALSDTVNKPEPPQEKKE